MNDYTVPDLADMPDHPSDWMKGMLVNALTREESFLSLAHLAKTGKSMVAVTVDFARTNTAEEEYTCDKCRVFHPDGLNVAVTAFGKDCAFAQIVVRNPMDLLDWCAVMVQVGLCHTCWAEEGYPPAEGSDGDAHFVSQAVRLMEAPDLATLTGWEL